MPEEKTSKSYGLGRRKTSVAQVWLQEDNAKTVNGLEFNRYFPTISIQKTATFPLELTSTADQYGFKARITGGGKRAQADALKLGLSRALILINPDWRKQLKAAGMLTRDPRAKERKKPGLKRARRAPQFSKR